MLSARKRYAGGVSVQLRLTLLTAEGHCGSFGSAEQRALGLDDFLARLPPETLESWMRVQSRASEMSSCLLTRTGVL